jgi:cytidylate kinase
MPDHLSQLREPESPRHGYRGEAANQPFLPAGLSIALSREAGSRGTSVAKRAGEKLGWQVYTQDMLEYIAQEPTVRREAIEQLTPAGQHWVEEQLERLEADGVTGDAADLDMARLILCLGATGEVLLIGRGAGCILPAHSTLHVRVVAPLEARIAYMSQWLRLSHDEAAEQVRLRDERRAEYIQGHFHRQAADVYQYDLLLNTALLGEELSAELLIQAARSKAAALVANISA